MFTNNDFKRSILCGLCASCQCACITCEVSLDDVGHLCKVAVAVEGDAGGHWQDVPDVGAQQGDVLL